jgi:hypothetical protein
MHSSAEVNSSFLGFIVTNGSMARLASVLLTSVIPLLIPFLSFPLGSRVA